MEVWQKDIVRSNQPDNRMLIHAPVAKNDRVSYVWESRDHQVSANINVASEAAFYLWKYFRGFYSLARVQLSPLQTTNKDAEQLTGIGCSVTYQQQAESWPEFTSMTNGSTPTKQRKLNPSERSMGQQFKHFKRRLVETRILQKGKITTLIGLISLEQLLFTDNQHTT